jgi:hypothetical protein
VSQRIKPPILKMSEFNFNPINTMRNIIHDGYFLKGSHHVFILPPLFIIFHCFDH